MKRLFRKRPLRVVILILVPLPFWYGVPKWLKQRQIRAAEDRHRPSLLPARCRRRPGKNGIDALWLNWNTAPPAMTDAPI